MPATDAYSFFLFFSDGLTIGIVPHESRLVSGCTFYAFFYPSSALAYLLAFSSSSIFSPSFLFSSFGLGFNS